MPKSVYLVEDEPDLSSILGRFLQSAGFDVVPFCRGDLALEAIRKVPPDLAILDLMLPGLDGLEVLKGMREQTDCPVLLISARVAEVDRILGLELGGDDYLPKPFSARELVARVKALFRRIERQEAPPETARRQGVSYRSLYLDRERKTVSCGDRSSALTLSEYSILSRMMAHPAKTYTREELLEPPVVYRGGDSRAVDMHIANLRRKITDLRPGFSALQSVRGVGYKL